MAQATPIAFEDLVLLNALVDGELDGPARAALVQRLENDVNLRAERDRLLALRRAAAAHLTKDRASDRLQKQIASIGRSASQLAPQPRSRYRQWLQIAAAVVLAAGLSSVLTYRLIVPGLAPAIPTDLVSIHRHALVAANPVDVPSSDRHTVKPWFDRTLAISPPVVDLASEGFALLGGRIDTLDGRRVPILIYRRREHLISLIVQPAPGGQDDGHSTERGSSDGYAVLSWRNSDFRLSAVSDVALADLETFVGKVRSARD